MIPDMDRVTESCLRADPKASDDVQGRVAPCAGRGNESLSERAKVEILRGL